MNSARAWHCRNYGAPSVLECGTTETVPPGPGSVRVRVQATTVTAADSRIRRASFPRGFGLLGRLAFGLRRPRRTILGTECAGVVEAIGDGVTDWQVGDAVVAVTGARLGGHAEVWTSGKSPVMVKKPANLSFAEAVSLPFGGLTALHFLRLARVGEGAKILLIGASGAVGVATVQIARHLGAEVTAVTSGKNLALAESLGASSVINYERENYAQVNEAYECIIDCVGAGNWARFHPALRKGGCYCAVAGGLWEMIPWRKGTKRSIAGVVLESRDRLQEIMDFAEVGILRPVIDQTYPFDALPVAHARVDSGRKRGSVVVTMPDETTVTV